jgi:hypothetical protein
MGVFRRPWAPRPSAAGFRAWRAAAASAATAALVIVPLSASPWMIPAPAKLSRSATRAHGRARNPFSHIFLPDLVVISPRGLSAARLSRLQRLPGVRATLAVDGASVTMAGHTLNVLGVDPTAFRAWTPLRTASDQQLWSHLAAGGFIAAPSAERMLGLRPGQRYRIGRGPSPRLVFGGSGALGISGVGLVVSSTASARLGLIHGVATLVSAPSVAIPQLERRVQAVVGSQAELISVREQLPVYATAASGRPVTYLQLFRRSAALYCPGLSWTVLAAIGQIESGDGTNNGPSSAGALGPMQFMPSTWQRWGITAFGEPGPPDIMNPYDAVPSAARYLCAAGAARPGGLAGAIFAYNHANWYVSEVLSLAHQYATSYG